MGRGFWRRSWGQRFIAGAFVLAGGCSDSTSGVARALRGACGELGWTWCEPLPEPAELNDIILHLGNPAATPDHAGETFDRVLGRMLHRPGSTLRLWGASSHRTPLRLLAEVSGPPVTLPRSEQRRRSERLAWASGSREQLMSAATTALAVRTEPGSPAQALAEVALNNPAGKRERNIILLSDGLDTEVARVVCRQVSMEDDWMNELSWHRFTRPGLFSESRIYLAYFGPSAYPGCESTTLRYEVYSGMWFNFTSGAREVLLRRGPVIFTDAPFALVNEYTYRWR